MSSLNTIHQNNFKEIILNSIKRKIEPQHNNCIWLYSIKKKGHWQLKEKKKYPEPQNGVLSDMDKFYPVMRDSQLQ